MSGVPWLRNLLPCEPQDIVSVATHEEPSRWLEQNTTVTNLPPGPVPPRVSNRRKQAFRRGATDNAPAGVVSRRGFCRNAFGELPADRSFEEAEIRVVTGKTGTDARWFRWKVNLDHHGQSRIGARDRADVQSGTRAVQIVGESAVVLTQMLEVPLELYTSTDFIPATATAWTGSSAR